MISQDVNNQLMLIDYSILHDFQSRMVESRPISIGAAVSTEIAVVTGEQVSGSLVLELNRDMARKALTDPDMIATVLHKLVVGDE